MSCPELAPDPPATSEPADTADPDAIDPAAEAVAEAVADTTDSASQALAAIASTYEDARAGIISGDPSPSAAQHAEALPHSLGSTSHSPTVPLTLMTGLKRAAPAQNPVASEPEATTTLWSRLVRRGQAARRGRHSAPEAGGLPAEAVEWGPPGRVRFLSQA